MAHGHFYPADEVDVLVRELDVLLNGEAGAAPQAMLIDIIGQIRKAKHDGVTLMGEPNKVPGASPQRVRFPTAMRKMWSGGEVQGWLEEQGPLYRNGLPLAMTPTEWNDRQMLEFLTVALRNVDITGTLAMRDVRDGFQYMQDKLSGKL
jgi:hypothetical protein